MLMFLDIFCTDFKRFHPIIRTFKLFYLIQIKRNCIVNIICVIFKKSLKCHIMAEKARSRFHSLYFKFRVQRNFSRKPDIDCLPKEYFLKEDQIKSKCMHILLYLNFQLNKNAKYQRITDRISCLNLCRHIFICFQVNIEKMFQILLSR